MVTLNFSNFLFVFALLFFCCGKKDTIAPFECMLQNQKYFPRGTSDFFPRGEWRAEAVLKNNTLDTIWAYCGIGNNLLVSKNVVYMRYHDRIDKLTFYPEFPMARMEAIPPKSYIVKSIIAVCQADNWTCPIESFIIVIPRLLRMKKSLNKDDNRIDEWSQILGDSLKEGVLYSPDFYFHLDENCTRFSIIHENIDSMFKDRNIHEY